MNRQQLIELVALDSYQTFVRVQRESNNKFILSDTQAQDAVMKELADIIRIVSAYKMSEQAKEAIGVLQSIVSTDKTYDYTDLLLILNTAELLLGAVKLDK